MIYCIGLGNPGEKYQLTRHNIGVRALETIHNANEFSTFMLPQHKQFRSSTGKIASTVVVLVKPEVFMNNSGQVVGHFKNDLQKELSGLVVIHDDVALPIGSIRISEGRGDGGHNGVKSIIAVLGTKKFIRIRIGVAPVPTLKENNLETFVLKKFTSKEEKELEKVLPKVSDALICMLEKGIEVAMNSYN
jgi:PTH1 family peptidyl-tRNA hydrolase